VTDNLWFGVLGINKKASVNIGSFFFFNRSGILASETHSAFDAGSFIHREKMYKQHDSFFYKALETCQQI
jgi:hypothetical protein